MRTQTDSDLNLGFVGLGNMGSGIAGSIARSLGRLMVYDIDETKRRSFAGSCDVATDIQEVFRHARVLLLSLPGSPGAATASGEATGPPR